MMKKGIDYARTHKLTLIIFTIVLYLIIKNSLVTRVSVSPVRSPMYSPLTRSIGFGNADIPDMEQEDAPIADVTDRKVVTNSNFSLLVKNVTDSINQIKTKVTSVSGYLIDVNIYRGETSESANLSLRVPSNNVDEISKYLRSISVKVVSENITGTDITDQYIDIETRISELQKVKSKLEMIMDNAITSDEMLRVFRQISDINTQIDSYKGRLKYMDTSSQTSRLTVVLSTDELSLPYAPVQTWRPEVIFKTAVRSLLSTLQNIGTIVIWGVVYLPFIFVVLLIAFFIKKKLSKAKTI